MKVWLQHVATALGAYGLWGIFILSVLDSFGVPLPAAMDVLLIGIAAASVKEPQHAWFAAALAIVGSVAGNVALFLTARRGARWMRPGAPSSAKAQRFHEWFDRYGLLTVFVPAVTPVVPLPLKVFVISAGAMRTSLTRFILVIVVARSVRFLGEVCLGLLLGHEAQALLMRHGWTLAIFALALGIAAFLLMRALSHKREPAL